VAKVSVRDIVFVSFPFSDLTQSKLRPALVLANAQRQDWLLCQITSKSYADNYAIPINEQNYTRGSLELTSYVRPHKLFTANEIIIIKNVASLNIETHYKIINIIQQILINGK
jgi:mRNA interferase MazF